MKAAELSFLRRATAVTRDAIRRPRPVRVYVASSARNERFEAVVARLREEGHLVYDFKAQPTFFSWELIAGKGPCSAEKHRTSLSHFLAHRAFRADMIGLLECDACVLVLPAGASSHVELGFAVGAGKQTIVLLAEG